jgi:glycerol-3-phosphate dehydrogenase
MLTPQAVLSTSRASLLSRLEEGGVADLAIVGGGATGLGVALDAAAQGLRVVLVESHDFAKGTSSRSTKLVHGGVRYLAQGHLGLVREALHERRTLLHNAPHLAQPLPFVVPSYRWWETPYHAAGLLLYDLLAGRAGLGHTRVLGRQATCKKLPALQTNGLRGGVMYWDGQFDDARLALALARTAAAHGALLVNYLRADGLLYAAGQVSGLQCSDALNGGRFQVRARCVVNATGVWVDELRQQDGVVSAPPGAKPVRPMVTPSQGVHLVVDQDFLPGEAALMVPHTADGRVLFAVPWLGKLILGTTDTPRQDRPREPKATDLEADFILRELAPYLIRPPQAADVRSLWVGLRPLVRPPDKAAGHTPDISREHSVLVSPSGLISVTGGKWTSYRAMAEDVLLQCAKAGLLPVLRRGVTANLPLLGGSEDMRAVPLCQASGLHSYGSEAAAVMSLPGAQEILCEGLTEAMVRFAARHEYALTVEDMLARRSRLLFLDARLAARLAVRVGALLQQETGLDPQIRAFEALAEQYAQWPQKSC